MKKFAIILSLILFCCETAFAEDESKQTIQNTKGFLGVNYDRQDSEQVGVQKIVNDHSFFNINIQIIKKGALFNKEDEE